MMLEITLRPLAKNDIKKIWHYTYEHWGDIQADTYVSNLGQSIESIIDNPKIVSVIDHVREGYRLLYFKHHLVIYRITNKTIEVVRVLGENMDVIRHI